MQRAWTCLESGLKKAEVFIREAERHLGLGIYWLACFEAQQAAELYLKAYTQAHCHASIYS
ncbi:MAG: HEPN domain-containing protein [Ignisphaera sp.]